MNRQLIHSKDASFEQIRAHLNRMKHAHVSDGPASAKVRLDRLGRAVNLLLTHQDDLAAAISADFGNRSRAQTMLADIGASVASLRHNQQHLGNWMRPQPRIEPFPGSEAWVEYQPLGVVGIVSPWNFPLVLAFGPLGSAFSAGNRAMLKPSEYTPRTSALLAELVPRYFDSTELMVVTGGAETGAAFSTQPFDHLIFTGSTTVAHHVMRAASDNLVPVTLELGGKSPVIVASDANVQQAAARILTVKTFNAGQICLSPDYVLLLEDQVEPFINAARNIVEHMYPTLYNNEDYTSIINESNFERLHRLLDDARTQGAGIVELNPAKEDLDDRIVRKIAPTLIVGAKESMEVMQNEIFGPILPIITYRNLDDALKFINRHARPLAAYFFGNRKVDHQTVAAHTTSGALVINDVMTHVFAEELPFGGVGASGMGHYHGEYGFRTLSHTKPVLVQSLGGESNLLMRAPYSEATYETLSRQLQA